MVRFVVATFLSPLLWRCGALSADGDSKPNMIRSQKHREPTKHSALELDASGEIVRGSQATPAPAPAATCPEHVEAFPRSGDSTCGEAFVEGIANSNDCSDAEKQTTILQQSLCDFARTQSGATTATQVVPYNETKLCPIGCHKRGDHFFYNPRGDCPSNPESLGGTPVCRKFRYQNSTTKDSNENCPDSYERIMTKDECKTAAICQGFCMSDEWFVVGQRDPADFVTDDDRPAWADSFDSFPTGCFIRDEDGCAYFNDAMTGTEHARPAAPTDPKGMGMCKISARYS